MNTPNPSRRPRSTLRSIRPRGVGRAGFTLVELLSVIAIIGVLAAILIPVVGSVRGSAKSSGCATNLRQVGIAIQCYVSDNKGTLPPGGAWISPRYDADPRHFQAALVQYLSQTKTTYWGTSSDKRTYSPMFDCPGYKGENPLAARYAFQPNETDYDGTTKLKPWGFVYQDTRTGQFLIAPKPLKHAAVPAKNKAISDISSTAPNHSGHQNTLYFDWHVGRVAVAN